MPVLVKLLASCVTLTVVAATGARMWWVLWWMSTWILQPASWQSSWLWSVFLLRHHWPVCGLLLGTWHGISAQSLLFHSSFIVCNLQDVGV